jgi:Tfp pilus assembly protein PilF
MNLFCGNCGQAGSDREAFCVACGHRLRHPDNAPPVEALEGASSEDTVALKYALDLLAARNNETALVVLKRICDDRPDWAVARAYHGIALLRTTKVNAARDELEVAVHLAPNSFICRSRYAEFFARLGFYDQAMGQLDAALAAGPPDDASRYAALELRQFCKEKAKDLYYREFRYPRLPFRKLLPGRLFQSRTTQLNGEGN